MLCILPAYVNAPEYFRQDSRIIVSELPKSTWRLTVWKNATGVAALWHSLVNSLYQHPLVLLTPKVTRRIATPDNTFFAGYSYAAKTVAVLGA